MKNYYFQQKKEDIKISYYTHNLKETNEDSKDVCIKTVTSPKKVSYFIKICNEGLNTGFPKNPFDGPSQSKDGIDAYSWHGVTEQCHKLYVLFLKTKNAVYLRQLEREINQNG